MDKVAVIPANQLLPIYPKAGFPNGLTVINLSLTETIYLTDQAGTFPGTGTPLGPGNVGTWAAKRDLYASTGTANPSLLGLSDAMATLFPAGAVAQQLIAQGLNAPAIAAQIALLGAPPINAWVTLLALNQTTTGAPQSSAIVDVSKYQSISYILADIISSVNATPLPRQVDFIWLDATGVFRQAVDTIYVSDTNNNAFGGLAINAQGQIPVRAPKLQIIVGTTARTGTNFQGTIQGTYRTIPRMTYEMNSAYWGISGVGSVSGAPADNFQGWNFAKGAAQLDEYPSTSSGDVALWVTCNLPSASLSIIISDAVSGLQLAQITSSAVIDEGFYFKAPNRPLHIQVGPAATTSTGVHITLVVNGN